MTFLFERFVAYRYLRSAQGQPEGGRFLGFIMVIAISGVTVGVASLILALSIVRGFREEIETKIMGFGAHVQVENLQEAPLDTVFVGRSALMARPEVETVVDVTSGFVLMRHASGEIEGLSLWGTSRIPPFLEGRIVRGEASLAPDATGLPGVLIGQSLAQTWGAEVGDRLTAFRLPEQGLTSGFILPVMEGFRIAGIYETHLANFDAIYVLAPIASTRRILGIPEGQVSRFDVYLHAPESATEVARTFEEDFGFPVLARSVFEVYRNLYSWVGLQERIVPVVISVLVFIGAFNVIGILLMLILEKAREIGILSSMGASPRRIRRLFVFLGGMIGAVGSLSGIGLAWALALLQTRYQFIPLPADAYYIDKAPISIVPIDMFLIGLAATLLCVIAAWIPAQIAARLEPIRVLRFR